MAWHLILHANRLGDDDQWHRTIVQLDNAGNHIRVSREPEGLVVPVAAISERLSCYVGQNRIGELIQGYLQRGDTTHGQEWYTRGDIQREMRGNSVPDSNSGMVPTVITWAVTEYVSSPGALFDVPRTNNPCSEIPLGPTEMPRPITDVLPVRGPAVSGEQEDGNLVKRHNRANDRWRVERRIPGEPEDLLATCQTETLADRVIAMLDNPLVVVSVHGGSVQDIRCPYDMIPLTTFLVVDRDTQTAAEEELVCATDANGTQISAFVYQADICHPAGATDVDRLVDAFYNRRSEE